jgi:hypothetical protein
MHVHQDPSRRRPGISRAAVVRADDAGVRVARLASLTALILALLLTCPWAM